MCSACFVATIADMSELSSTRRKNSDWISKRWYFTTFLEWLRSSAVCNTASIHCNIFRNTFVWIASPQDTAVGGQNVEIQHALIASHAASRDVFSTIGPAEYLEWEFIALRMHIMFMYIWTTQMTSLKLWLRVNNEIFLVGRDFSVHPDEKLLGVAWFMSLVVASVWSVLFCSNFFMLDGDKWPQTWLCPLSTILHTNIYSFLSANALFAL